MVSALDSLGGYCLFYFFSSLKMGVLVRGKTTHGFYIWLGCFLFLPGVSRVGFILTGDERVEIRTRLSTTILLDGAITSAENRRARP